MIYGMHMALLGLSMVFLSVNHPIGLGLLLIIHTLMISALTGLVGGNFWFSYILFLVFLGGVLVLFIYMTSLAANEKFDFNWQNLVVILIFGFLIFLGLIFYFLPAGDKFNEATDWALSGLGTSSFSSLMMKLYSAESYKVTLLLIFYLLYSLLVCADIVNKYTGPLRNFN